MEKIKLETREEYAYCKNRGFEPLFDERFEIPFELRDELQKEQVGFVIGNKNRPKANQKFYELMWKNKEHKCEECGKDLPTYSSTFVSHIFSRGAFPEMAYDTRNINILCGCCHQQWETGDRLKMRIFEKNREIQSVLRKEYNR